MAIVAGSMYAACVPPARGAYADSIMAAAALGIPIWGITSVILLPLLSGSHMAWDAVGCKGTLRPWLAGYSSASCSAAYFKCPEASVSSHVERQHSIAQQVLSGRRLPRQKMKTIKAVEAGLSSEPRNRRGFERSRARAQGFRPALTMRYG